MSLYRADPEIRLREEAHREYCSSKGGAAFNIRERDNYADQVVASMAGVLEETTLSGPEIVELRREMQRPAMGAVEGAKRMDAFVDGMRRSVYRDRARVEATAAAIKQAAHASPALRKALNTGNAANSVVLGRAAFRRASDGETSILRKL